MAGGSSAERARRSIVLSPSGLSKLMDRMETSGMIRRDPDRATPVRLWRRSLPGRALVKKARRSHHKLLQQTFGDALDDRDVADLTRIMGRIGASLAEQ